MVARAASPTATPRDEDDEAEEGVRFLGSLCDRIFERLSLWPGVNRGPLASAAAVSAATAGGAASAETVAFLRLLGPSIFFVGSPSP